LLPAAYIAAVCKDGTAQAGSEHLDPQISASEFVFLNLRLIEGFEPARFEDRFGLAFEERFGAVAERLFEGGLLLREGGRVRLSDRGLELADSVFAEFL
jgi:coproporphyrinogen III oxidase-like Fe-S oxidoreductase